MLDELILGGEIQETSKKNVLKAISAQDLLQEVCQSFLYFYYYQLAKCGGKLLATFCCFKPIVVSSIVVSNIHLLCQHQLYCLAPLPHHHCEISRTHGFS